MSFDKYQATPKHCVKTYVYLATVPSYQHRGSPGIPVRWALYDNYLKVEIGLIIVNVSLMIIIRVLAWAP